MKKNFIWIAVGILMIILPTLAACDNTSSSPDDPLNGTQWNLIFYRKTSVIEGTKITVKFDNGEINGTAGCNSYFGSYQVEGDKITFGSIAKNPIRAK